VSHEIRNPLSAVLHLAEEVKEIACELSTKSEAQDEIAEIMDAAEHASRRHSLLLEARLHDAFFGAKGGQTQVGVLKSPKGLSFGV
jgi:signal transduction histidine kinase